MEPAHKKKGKGERERVEIAGSAAARGDPAARLEGMRGLFGPAAAEAVLEAEAEMQLRYDAGNTSSALSRGVGEDGAVKRQSRLIS